MKEAFFGNISIIFQKHLVGNCWLEAEKFGPCKHENTFYSFISCLLQVNLSTCMFKAWLCFP